MSYWLRTILRSMLGLLLFGFLLASPEKTFAQLTAGSVLAQVASHADTVPYVLVVFCLILGFIIVCRSANRSPEGHLTDLDEM